MMVVVAIVIWVTLGFVIWEIYRTDKRRKR